MSNASILTLSLGRKTRRDILLVVTPIGIWYTSIGKRHRGMQLIRKFSILCYSLADILKVKPDPYLISYMGTLIFLGDEISDKSRGILMNGALEHIPKKHPIHKVYNKFVARSNAKQLKNIMSSLAQIQDETASRQFNKLSCDELKNATRMKGGYTLLALLHILKESPTEEEKEAFMNLGFLIQLLDDYHDVIIDKDEGISTLCTEDCYKLKDVNSVIYATKKKWIDTFGDTTEVRRFFLYLRLYRLTSEITHKYPLLYAIMS